jgi:capsular exopolysaccharide synthesis family protein
MGKVYDALRKAEEQRARRIQDAAASAPPQAFEAPAPAAPAPATAPPEATRSGARGAMLRGALPELDRDSGAANKRRIAILQPDSFAAEQLRTLRARLDAMSAERPLRTIAVTSALPGDGKSLVAIGLAAVSAMNLGRRVLLVDADMREPSVATSLGLRVDAGLAEVLAGTAQIEEAVVHVDATTLDVLPVRGLPQNPSELLASDPMEKLMATLASRYDLVVLDLPPTLGLPDAKTMSQLCDGVVFVVRADVTPEPDVVAALEVLGRERVLGLVLNGGEQVRRYGYPA